MTDTKRMAAGEPAVETFELLESQVRSYSRNFPAIFDRAKGSWLVSRDGEHYLDFLMGCSTLNYGHNHPVLKGALIDYISNDGITHSLDMHSNAKERFLFEFHETVLKPRDLDYVLQFPGPTGANAVEAAMKLARKVTGRQNVIAFTNGFHGVSLGAMARSPMAITRLGTSPPSTLTLGALAATGNQHHRGGAGIDLGGVTRMPYDGYMGDDMDTADYLDRVLSDPSSGVDEPAAVIVEAVQGEGGLNAASDDWLRKVAKITRKHGALLIVDDIQAGVGRCGSFFSFEPSGIKPDIVTMAKSVSGYGLPMALVLIDRRYDEWLPGEHNGTFRGNCHAFVTARAALEYFWRDRESMERAIAEKSAILEQRLQAIIDRNQSAGIVMKGRGMMRGLQMPSGEFAADVIDEAYKNGLIIESAGPEDEVVKCLAALTITDDELEQGLQILGNAVDAVAAKRSREAA